MLATGLNNAQGHLRHALLIPNLIPLLCAVLLLVLVMWLKLVIANPTLALATLSEQLVSNAELNKVHVMLLRLVLVALLLALLMVNLLQEPNAEPKMVFAILLSFVMVLATIALMIPSCPPLLCAVHPGELATPKRDALATQVHALLILS